MTRGKLGAASRSIAVASGLLLGAATLGACAPVKSERGYVVDADDIARIETGPVSKAEVTEIMGSPSTSTAIRTEGDTWFYIASTFEQTAFMAPEEVERRVVVIRFDQADMVAEIAEYTLEDGIVVDFVERRTPTRGKDLSLLGEIFGNIGRFNSVGGGGPIPGR